ncbi:MAG: hypothetical protein O3A80_03225 [bacterium]|nr:hypothetical protein [bacterium]MDA1292611.1 hypothetical protein [bacterium]
MNPKQLHKLGLFLLVAAILVAAAGLISRAWYEVSSGVLHIDAQIFQTVGRGMLNGLQPYADLFETKPPGIFLLHALSLKLFGSQFLVKLLQAIVLLGIPVLVLIPVLSLVEDRPAAQRKIISLTTILFGLLLSLYTANQAGLGLPESYGAFFAMMALAIIASGKRLKGIFALALLMLFSVGFKEPFLLIILAGVILLQKDLLTSFIYPFFVAAALGLIALLMFGLAVPFFQVYLPHMFGFHVHQHGGSTFLRALEVWRTFINIGAYSWWFAMGVLMLWIYVGYTSLRSHSLVRWFVGSYLMFIAIAIGGDFYGHHFIFAVPVYVVLWWVCIQQKLFMWPVALLMIATAFTSTQLSFASQYALWEKKEEEMKNTALVIDIVMDRCGWDRYLQMIVREGGPYAYTTHSPYGPVFVHYSRFLGASPMYQKAHIRALQDAPLILLDDLEKTNLTDVAKEYLGVRYAEDAPACAGEDFVQPLPFHLLFRQS